MSNYIAGLIMLVGGFIVGWLIRGVVAEKKQERNDAKDED